MRVHVNRRHPGPRDERGAVAVVVALVITPLMLLSAFTLDLGMAYAQGQSFAAGADSAALAIADAKRTALLANPSVRTTCQTLVASDAGQALAIAKRQVDANRPFDVRASTGQVDVQVRLSCVDSAGQPRADGALRVDVTVKRDVPTTLGRLAGVASVRTVRDAAAGLSGSTTAGGVFPLAICDQQADAIIAGAVSRPYPDVAIETDKVWHPGCASGSNGKGKGNGKGSGGSGNWGWLDCGGGNGTPALASAILGGCALDFSLTGSPPSLTLDGTTGNKVNAGPVKAALLGVVGSTVAFPVYDDVSGNGANTEYNVTGFIQLEIVGVDGSGDLTVRYVGYSAAGQFNAGCGIGSTSCPVYNTYVTGLVS